MTFENLPSTVFDLSIWFNFYIGVGFLIWHHHVGFTSVITVGIWDPNVLDITSFYGNGTVQLSGKTGIFPILMEIGINSVLLSIK